MNEYKAGNSVRMSCEFRDYSDQLANPSTVTFRVYDVRYNIVHETSMSESNKESTGKYFYEYAIPMEFVNQKMYYEWHGEILGSPSLNRGSFKVVFI